MATLSAAPAHRLANLLAYLLLGLLTLWLAAYAVLSLQWRMTHDTPIVFYPAFLIDHFGFVPYRDLFTDTFPGTLAFHIAVGRLIDYSDGIRFRLVDLSWLALIGVVTWGVMRRFGKQVAWASVVLFSLLFLHEGPILSFQRDYLGILPVALATWVGVSQDRLKAGTVWKYLLVGFLFGLAATIKPQMALGAPLLLLYMVVEANEGTPLWRLVRTWIGAGLVAAAGMALPLALVFLWLWRSGGLAGYREMLTYHLPLYLSLTGEHKVITSQVLRWLYDLQEVGKIGGFGIWLAPAALGTYLALQQAGLDRKRRLFVLLMVGQLVMYGIYVVLGAKFWPYHWLPFLYFTTLLASLCLLALPDVTGAAARLAPVITLAVVCFLAFPPSNDFYGQLWGQTPRSPEGGRADAIAAYLADHLEPGDTVQALDWTGGGNHALLIVKAKMATPFFEDYEFYHHISNPFIQELRRRFVSRLQEVKPRFIVEVLVKPRVSGPDTTTEFPALRQFMDEHYTVASTGDGYLIYEWRQ